MSEANLTVAPEAAVEKQVAMLEGLGYKQELKRVVGTWDIVLYGIIYACPIAGFLIFGYVYELAAGMVSLAYLVTTIGMVFTANSYGWLATEFPLAGSAYNYISRGISHLVGSFAGWALMLDYFLIPTSLYIWSGMALQGLFPEVAPWVWIVVLVLINTLINIRGIELTVQVNRALLLLQLFGIAWFAYAVLSYVLSGQHPEAQMSAYAFFRPNAFTFPVLMTAIALVVYNFLGVDASTTLVEEAKGGGKAVGLGMAGSTMAMGLFFCLTTWLGTLMVPAGSLIAPEDQGNALYVIARTAGGEVLYWVISLIVVIAVGFGVSIAGQTAIARLWYGMARDHLLPTPFSWVHSRYKTPWFGIVVIALVSVTLGIFFVDQGALITSFINFGALLTFSGVNVACMYYFIVRNRRRFNPVFHIICPLCGLFVTGWGFLSLGPYAMTLGCAWLGLGVIYFGYVAFVKKVPIKFSEI